MSENFCILIPSKVFRVEKRFAEKLQAWVVDNCSNFPPNYSMLPLPGFRDNPLDNFHKSLPNYSILSLSEFRDRQDVNLDLPERLYSRYHVIDWGFCFMSHNLQSFLFWLAKIYVYGEVGLLNYWSSSNKSFPPVTVGNTEETIWNLSESELPLDKLLFFPLSNYLT